MAYNKLLTPTAQVTTSNWGTVDDTLTGGQLGLGPQIPQAFGTVYPVFDTVTNTVLVLQYVKYNPSSTATPPAQGGPLYYSDITRAAVSMVVADAATYAAASDSASDAFAGVFGGSVAPAAVGDGIWILKRGWYANFNSSGITMAKGDRAVLSNAAATLPVINVYTRVAAGTAPATAEASNSYIVATGPTSGSFFPGFLMAEWP